MELVYEFAKEYGISENLVKEFEKKKSKVTTLNELENLPSGLLNHIRYIPYCPEPLKSYITDRMWVERYMTVTLERVADSIRDDMDYDDSDDLLDTENNKELEKVIKCMIDHKFGSVVFDW